MGIGFGIALGQGFKAFEQAQKDNDEHAIQQYQIQQNNEDLTAQQKIAKLPSKVGQVVGSKTLSMSPQDFAQKFNLQPGDVSGLQSADDYNNYIGGAVANPAAGGPPPPAAPPAPAGAIPAAPPTSAPTPIESSPLAPPPTPAAVQGIADVNTLLPPTASSDQDAAPPAAPTAAAAPSAQNAAAPAPAPPPAQLTPVAALTKAFGKNGHVLNAVWSHAANMGASPLVTNAAGATIAAESGGNASALNVGPDGTRHVGLGQFDQDTWQRVMGPNADINNPDQQVVGVIKNIQGALPAATTALGRTPDEGELYVAHQQGPAGGPALLAAYARDPNMPAADALRAAGAYHDPNKAAAAINNNLPAKGMQNPTVGQFVDGWKAKIDGLLGRTPGSAQAQGQGAIPTNIPPPPVQAGVQGPETGNVDAATYGMAGNTSPSDSMKSYVAYTVTDPVTGAQQVRLTNQPIYGTPDDDNLAAAQIYRQAGRIDKAMGIEKQVLANQQMNALTQHEVLANAAAKLDTAFSAGAATGSLQPIVNTYNQVSQQMGWGTTLQGGINQNGDIAIRKIDNNTGQPIPNSDMVFHNQPGSTAMQQFAAYSQSLMTNRFPEFLAQANNTAVRAYGVAPVAADTAARINARIYPAQAFSAQQSGRFSGSEADTNQGLLGYKEQAAAYQAQQQKLQADLDQGIAAANQKGDQETAARLTMTKQQISGMMPGTKFEPNVMIGNVPVTIAQGPDGLSRALGVAPAPIPADLAGLAQTKDGKTYIGGGKVGADYKLVPGFGYKEMFYVPGLVNPDGSPKAFMSFYDAVGAYEQNKKALGGKPTGGAIPMQKPSVAPSFNAGP